jgi:hypothetical protein
VKSPIWVPSQAILIIYDQQIARHGGAAGERGAFRGVAVRTHDASRGLMSNPAVSTLCVLLGHFMARHRKTRQLPARTL